MAEGKKSFTAYCDWLEMFEELSDEEAGQLAKHMFRYVNDLNPEPPDRIVKVAFIEIKKTLKRDLTKWMEKAETNRINGSKGGRPKNLKETQNNRTVNSETHDNPKKGVTVTDTVTDTDTVKVKETIKDRKVEFSKKILTHIEAGYISREDANDFYFYWTEHGENDRKMKFEKQKSFGVKQRLRTWKEKKKNFAPQKKKERISLDEIEQELLSQGTGIDFNNHKLLEP